MTVAVKICGLKNDASIDAAIEAGADYIGLVFHAASPRNVDLDAARSLAMLARDRAKIVTLLVDPDDDTLAEVVAGVEPDLIQLHGAETPERVRQISKHFLRPVMKAIRVSGAGDAESARAYVDVAELILFDAKAPEDRPGALPGGNGIAFDWQALEGVRGKFPFMLAGGLTPLNVAEAIRRTGAAAVDVSSGVESAPGEKDPDLIRRFLRAAKTANENPTPAAGGER
jgi:phosphoribosylanthranilate isomerase